LRGYASNIHITQRGLQKPLGCIVDGLIKTRAKMEILTEKQCKDCHQVKPIERFTIQKKNGVPAHYKGRCKDCYVIYNRKRRESGFVEVLEKPENKKQYWKHISWL
jgi:hypothetical protein